jgi:hypothetical protein
MSNTSASRKTSISKDRVQLARGYFEFVEYIAGRLIILGWMLLPEKRFDKISIFINKKYACTNEIFQRDDVVKVFPFIPHAKYSGFSFSLQKSEEEMDDLIDICLIGIANGEEVAKMETCYSKKLSLDMPDTPIHLMERVTGNENPSFFKATTFQSYCNYSKMVGNHRDPKQMRTMLDWRCGCGRLTNMFSNLTKIPEIHGCDVDSEAIEWCKKNISRAQFSVIPLIPPTQYADNFFDLVIGNSVFTHLTRDLQHAWLGEIISMLGWEK